MGETEAEVWVVEGLRFFEVRFKVSPLDRFCPDGVVEDLNKACCVGVGGALRSSGGAVDGSV